MLTADSVTRTIKGRALVDQVSVRFEPGKLNVIIGPNGAGKSTLLKILSGQEKPSAGTVSYDGRALASMGLGELARVRAILSQNIEIAFPLRVREVVMMGRYPHLVGRPGPHDEQACIDVMRFFDVESMADRDYLTLSGGEQQRVHFARVLAQLWDAAPGTRRYLFLDEPLTFLDIYYQLELMRKLRSLLEKRDLVAVGVLHDLNLAAQFADSLVLLHEGRVLAAGPKEAVLTREHIHTAFRVAPRVVRTDDGGTQLFFE